MRGIQVHGRLLTRDTRACEACGSDTWREQYLAPGTRGQRGPALIGLHNGWYKDGDRTQDRGQLKRGIKKLGGCQTELWLCKAVIRKRESLGMAETVPVVHTWRLRPTAYRLDARVKVEGP